jgi:UDP-glucose 4-epimerase
MISSPPESASTSSEQSWWPRVYSSLRNSRFAALTSGSVAGASLSSSLGQKIGSTGGSARRGPFLPSPLVKPGRIPVVPGIPSLRFQAVHSRDVGRAYRLALIKRVHGPFNIAAEPVLDPPTMAKTLGARVLPLSARVARALASTSWHLRLQPTPPGWLDMGLSVPLMEVTRARKKLGWTPEFGADEALRELLEGMSDGSGAETPPLDPATTGPLRVRELLTRVGACS